MKSVNILIILFILAITSFSLESCEKKCKNAPQARIINNGTSKASVQIKTSDGNTVNIKDVDPSTALDYSTYAIGTITFTIAVDSNSYVEIIQMNYCSNYDITIEGNNSVTTYASGTDY